MMNRSPGSNEITNEILIHIGNTAEIFLRFGEKLSEEYRIPDKLHSPMNRRCISKTETGLRNKI